MSQQNDQSNLFALGEFLLVGDGVQITYLTSDKNGYPQFTYKDAEYDCSYIGDEIHSQQSDLGALITVTLRSIPDLGSDTITLIVPHFRVANLSASVETLAIKCHNSTPMTGPQLGVSQTYQCIPLKGSVQNPNLR